MKFLNKNTYFTVEQDISLNNLFDDINNGVYNKFLQKNLRRNYSLLDVGYRSGYLLFKCAQSNLGNLYGVDNNSLIPSAKETFKFNNIKTTQIINTTNILDTVRSLILKKEIDVIVNSFYKDLNKEIVKVLSDGKYKTIFFSLDSSNTQYEILYSPQIEEEPVVEIKEEIKEEVVVEEVKPKQKRARRKRKPVSTTT